MCGINDGLTAKEVAREIAKMRHLPTKSDEQRKATVSKRRAKTRKMLNERKFQKEIRALECGC